MFSPTVKGMEKDSVFQQADQSRQHGFIYTCIIYCGITMLGKKKQVNMPYPHVLPHRGSVYAICILPLLLAIWSPCLTSIHNPAKFNLSPFH